MIGWKTFPNNTLCPARKASNKSWMNRASGAMNRIDILQTSTSQHDKAMPCGSVSHLNQSFADLDSDSRTPTIWGTFEEQAPRRCQFFHNHRPNTVILRYFLCLPQKICSPPNDQIRDSQKPQKSKRFLQIMLKIPTTKPIK
jgi:hypothetical protein